MNTHLSFPLIVVLAAGCAGTRSADRAPAQATVENDATMNTATPAASERQDTAQAGATPDARTGEALMLVGIYPESTLAEACGITLPPAAFFEFDSATLEAPDNSLLRELATCLTTGPMAGRKVEVVGHASPVGTDDYNKRLGRSRAESVQDFLQQQGVAQDNIVTRSMGEMQAEEATPSEWPLYRRVDIRLLDE